MSINRFIVMGHLGADPETRYTPKGDPVVNVRVATNRSYTDRETGEIKKATEWHRLVAFGKRAEVIGKFCAQGDKVYFESFHRTRKFVDQTTKQDRYVDEFVITFIELTTKRGDVADPGGDEHGAGGDEGGGDHFPAV